jgi:hypothetical protein
MKKKIMIISLILVIIGIIATILVVNNGEEQNETTTIQGRIRVIKDMGNNTYNIHIGSFTGNLIFKDTDPNMLIRDKSYMLTVKGNIVIDIQEIEGKDKI